MEKVLVLLPENNKGKYISKGYSDAFKSMSYFVIEKKIYDLNSEEIRKIKPDIIFIFWFGLQRSKEALSFLFNEEYSDAVKINVSELKSDIPKEYTNGNNVFCFSSDYKKGKFRILPAILPEAYKRKFTDFKYMITFSGNPAYEERAKLLSEIIYNFGIINIFCRSYDFYKSVDEIYKNKLLDDKYIDLYRASYRGYVESQKELSFIYSHSKVNIDLSSEKNKPINYRCMEILASGGFVISPYTELLAKHFDDGREIETYKSASELIDKIRFYLKNPNISLMITANGRRNVVSNHNTYDRLKQILKAIYEKDSCN